MGIWHDSMDLGGFQKFFRVKSDPECDSASVGDHFEELFRITLPLAGYFMITAFGVSGLSFKVGRVVYFTVPASTSIYSLVPADSAKRLN